MIDRIYQTVKIILNTDGRGNVSPNEFNLLLHNVVLERFENLFFELSQTTNRQNRGLINGGIENVTDNIRQKIDHYINPATALTYSGGAFTVPADLRYFDSVLYGTEEIEICHGFREFGIISKTDPTEEYPIGIKQGGYITVLPSTIVNNVTMSYLRNPLQAKWTYVSVDGVEVFNPAAGDYVDVDAHPSEEIDITLKVLQLFGINLKEQDIVQAVQAEKLTDFQQENAS